MAATKCDLIRTHVSHVTYAAPALQGVKAGLSQPKDLPMMRLHLALLLGLVVVACGDEGKRPLGASCVGDDECTSGLCAAGQCH